MTNKRMIWVTFRKKGIHKYPAAATDPNLQDVKYLGSEHRHVFWFKVMIEVWHDDRELEFHQFLNWLESLYDSSILNLDYMSCEMISDALAEKIYEKYPGRDFSIDIAEDGEVGSRSSYSAKNC